MKGKRVSLAILICSIIIVATLVLVQFGIRNVDVEPTQETGTLSVVIDKEWAWECLDENGYVGSTGTAKVYYCVRQNESDDMTPTEQDLLLGECDITPNDSGNIVISQEVLPGQFQSVWLIIQQEQDLTYAKTCVVSVGGDCEVTFP